MAASKAVKALIPDKQETKEVSLMTAHRTAWRQFPAVGCRRNPGVAQQVPTRGDVAKSGV